MLWAIRRMLQIFFIGLIVLAILGFGALLIINPTNFKDEISHAIQSHTGYEFKIQGPIEWSFRPQVALHFKDMTLEGPDGFKSPVVIAKDVHAIIDPYSLFSSDLVVKKLEAKDVIVTIEHSSTGKRNIDALKKLPNESLTTMTIVELALTNTSILYQDAAENLSVALNNAKINSTNLQFNPTVKYDPIAIKGTLNNLSTNFSADIDTMLKPDLANHTITLDPLNLTLDNIALKGTTTVSRLNDKPYITGKMTLNPVDMTAVFTGLNALHTKANLNTLAANIDAPTDNVTSKTDDKVATEATITPAPSATTTPAITTTPATSTTPAVANTPTVAKMPGKIQGEINFAYNTDDHVLELNDFSLQLSDGVLKGNCKAKLIIPYQAEFDLMASKLDLQPILLALNGIFSFEAISQDIGGKLAFVKTLSMNGKIAAADTKLSSSFTVSQLTANISAKDGVLNIMPVSLNAMGGNHNLGIILDLTQASPKLKINEQADNLDFVEFLKLFNSSSAFVGSANAKLSLEGTGNDMNSLRQTAAGILNISIKGGKFSGISIDTLLNYSVTALNDAVNQMGKGANAALLNSKANDWPKGQPSLASTSFDLLDLKSQINQGIAKSTVNITSAIYDLKATGGFSLTDGKVNYEVQATDKDLPPSLPQFVTQYVTQNPLKITITGTLGQFNYNPDLQSYLQNGIKQIQATITKQALASMVDATGASTLTSKSAEQIFIDAVKQIGQ